MGWEPNQHNQIILGRSFGFPSGFLRARPRPLLQKKCEAHPPSTPNGSPLVSCVAPSLFLQEIMKDPLYLCPDAPSVFRVPHVQNISSSAFGTTCPKVVLVWGSLRSGVLLLKICHAFVISIRLAFMYDSDLSCSRNTSHVQAHRFKQCLPLCTRHKKKWLVEFQTKRIVSDNVFHFAVDTEVAMRRKRDFI
jgi:hypothetical protein